MKPGRELDALVAEKVMGLPVVWSEEPYIVPDRPRKEGRHPYLKGVAGGVEYDWAKVARYSFDISAALVASEYMRRTYDCNIELKLLPSFLPAQRYAALVCGGDGLAYERPDITVTAGSDESLAHACCLALLAALGYKELS